MIDELITQACQIMLSRAGMTFETFRASRDDSLSDKQIKAAYLALPFHELLMFTEKCSIQMRFRHYTYQPKILIRIEIFSTDIPQGCAEHYLEGGVYGLLSHERNIAVTPGFHEALEKLKINTLKFFSQASIVSIKLERTMKNEKLKKSWKCNYCYDDSMDFDELRAPRMGWERYDFRRGYWEGRSESY